ncbi:unnamed protein product [Eruca vesicaria subsp. sativa]|uniref:Translation initiation factor IF-3 n=1 Tax=Eruca vesicaria subsp. sativa TaxID=29727 RepID=A0ABC8K4I4_ERUVS|nr:unnamed protein product [Eruca vesicaria subsp. sativa]
MAGVTRIVGFDAILTGTTKTVSYHPFSVKSKLFCLPRRLSKLSIVTLSPYHRRSPAVTCRYGGGGGGGGGGSRFPGDKRGRQKESENDDALDISAIRSATVRLIDGQQNMIGIVSKEEAVRRADEAELDLVILSPDADPPVVRMMDYSKYRYEQQKRKKEQQKKTTRMDLKELKMGYNIDQHDYSVRMRAARKFLQDGDKVKVIVNMKGRENEFRNIAIELLRRFQTEIGEVCAFFSTLLSLVLNWHLYCSLIDLVTGTCQLLQLATEESKNFRDRNLFIVLVPNKEVLKKAQEPPSKKKKKPADDEVSAAGVTAT